MFINDSQYCTYDLLATISFPKGTHIGECFDRLMAVLLSFYHLSIIYHSEKCIFILRFVMAMPTYC